MHGIPAQLGGFSPSRNGRRELHECSGPNAYLGNAIGLLYVSVTSNSLGVTLQLFLGQTLMTESCNYTTDIMSLILSISTEIDLPFWVL